MIKQKIILGILAISVCGLSSGEDRVYSWSSTKKHLKDRTLKLEDPRTIYARCKITDKYKVDFKECGYTGPVHTDVNVVSSEQKLLYIQGTKEVGNIDAEHIVPSNRISKFVECGKYSRVACRSKNKRFKKCHNDIINLVPAISTINRFRGDMTFGELVDGRYYYPFTDIDLKKSKDTRVLEPSNISKPRIAVAYLHMANVKCIGLSVKERDMYTRWLNKK